jgi:hypothetical protein
MAFKNDMANDMAPVGHFVWPRRAPRLALRLAPVRHSIWPRQAPSPAPLRSKNKNKIKIWLLLLAGKEGKKYFGFQSPRSPSSPSSPSSACFVGEAARRSRFFRPSSLSHPSKLYSSLGWLNSKVRKPFFPFTLRLIDVDGF